MAAAWSTALAPLPVHTTTERLPQLAAATAAAAATGGGAAPGRAGSAAALLAGVAPAGLLPVPACRDRVVRDTWIAMQAASRTQSLHPHAADLSVLRVLSAARPRPMDPAAVATAEAVAAALAPSAAAAAAGSGTAADADGATAAGASLDCLAVSAAPSTAASRPLACPALMPYPRSCAGWPKDTCVGLFGRLVDACVALGYNVNAPLLYALDLPALALSAAARSRAPPATQLPLLVLLIRSAALFPVPTMPAALFGAARFRRADALALVPAVSAADAAALGTPAAVASAAAAKLAPLDTATASLAGGLASEAAVGAAAQASARSVFPRVQLVFTLLHVLTLEVRDLLAPEAARRLVGGRAAATAAAAFAQRDASVEELEAACAHALAPYARVADLAAGSAGERSPLAQIARHSAAAAGGAGAGSAPPPSRRGGKLSRSAVSTEMARVAELAEALLRQYAEEGLRELTLVHDSRRPSVHGAPLTPMLLLGECCRAWDRKVTRPLAPLMALLLGAEGARGSSAGSAGGRGDPQERGVLEMQLALLNALRGPLGTAAAAAAERLGAHVAAPPKGLSALRSQLAAAREYLRLQDRLDAAGRLRSRQLADAPTVAAGTGVEAVGSSPLALALGPLDASEDAAGEEGAADPRAALAALVGSLRERALPEVEVAAALARLAAAPGSGASLGGDAAYSAALSAGDAAWETDADDAMSDVSRSVSTAASTSASGAATALSPSVGARSAAGPRGVARSEMLDLAPASFDHEEASCGISWEVVLSEAAIKDLFDPAHMPAAHVPAALRDLRAFTRGRHGPGAGARSELARRLCGPCAVPLPPEWRHMSGAVFQARVDVPVVDVSAAASGTGAAGAGGSDTASTVSGGASSIAALSSDGRSALLSTATAGSEAGDASAAAALGAGARQRGSEPLWIVWERAVDFAPSKTYVDPRSLADPSAASAPRYHEIVRVWRFCYGEGEVGAAVASLVESHRKGMHGRIFTAVVPFGYTQAAGARGGASSAAAAAAAAAAGRDETQPREYRQVQMADSTDPSLLAQYRVCYPPASPLEHDYRCVTPGGGEDGRGLAVAGLRAG
jgi:hypothetical protein